MISRLGLALLGVTVAAHHGARLTGLGATRAEFTAAHGLSLAGCPARTCFGPKVHTGAGTPYEFQQVIFGGGIVTQYEQNFARGTSLGAAETSAVANFPPGTKRGATGTVHSGGQSCVYLDLTSRTLGTIFGKGEKPSLKKLLGAPDHFSIELATADASGNWSVDVHDINDSLVGAGWYQKGNGC